MDNRKALLRQLRRFKGYRQMIEKSLKGLEEICPMAIFERGMILNGLDGLEKRIANALIKTVADHLPELAKDQTLELREQEIVFIDSVLSEIGGKDNTQDEIKTLKNLRNEVGTKGVRGILKHTGD